MTSIGRGISTLDDDNVSKTERCLLSNIQLEYETLVALQAGETLGKKASFGVRYRSLWTYSDCPRAGKRRGFAPFSSTFKLLG